MARYEVITECLHAEIEHEGFHLFSVDDVRAVVSASSPEEWSIVGLIFSGSKFDAKTFRTSETKDVEVRACDDADLFNLVSSALESQRSEDIEAAIAEDFGLSWVTPRTVEDAAYMGCGMYQKAGAR